MSSCSSRQPSCTWWAELQPRQLRWASVVKPRQIRAAPTVLHGSGPASHPLNVAQVHLGKERLVERGPLSLSMSSKQAGSALTAKVRGPMLSSEGVDVVIIWLTGACSRCLDWLCKLMQSAANRLALQPGPWSGAAQP